MLMLLLLLLMLMLMRVCSPIVLLRMVDPHIRVHRWARISPKGRVNLWTLHLDPSWRHHLGCLRREVRVHPLLGAVKCLLGLWLLWRGSRMLLMSYWRLLLLLLRLYLVGEQGGASMLCFIKKNHTTIPQGKQSSPEDCARMKWKLSIPAATDAGGHAG